MNFNEALIRIAAQLALDADQLTAYAAEDTIPGSHDAYQVPMPGRNPYGIPYTSDGKLLYALTRALRPDRVLESGTNYGGSAVHIASALKANGAGTLVTVDVADVTHGHIPADLLPYIELVVADIREWVGRAEATGFSLIHEDASHESDTVYAIYSHLRTLLPNGGVVLSHDTALGVSEYIHSGIVGAGFAVPPEYVYDESPCGFSVMRYVP